MKSSSENIATLLFMALGVIIGAAIVAMFVPENARSYLELKIGLVAGGGGGFAIYKLVRFLLSGVSVQGNR